MFIYLVLIKEKYLKTALTSPQSLYLAEAPFQQVQPSVLMLCTPGFRKIPPFFPSGPLQLCQAGLGGPTEDIHTVAKLRRL